MAQVAITMEEAQEKGKLPAVCMCCGAPATVWATKRLMLKPPQYNQVELAEIAVLKGIHALATSDYVRLRTSFCPQHQHYWTIRAIVLFGGAGLFFAAMLLAAILGVTAAVLNPVQPHKGLVAVAAISAVLGLVTWLVPLLIFCRNPIRAIGVGEGLIVLDNVGEAYVNTVKATR